MFRFAFLFVGLLAVAIGNAAAFAPINYNVLSSTNLAVGGYEKVTINTKTRLNAAALIVQNKGGGHGELGTHTLFFLYSGVSVYFSFGVCCSHCWVSSQFLLLLSSSFVVAAVMLIY
jgi:hypothetical protein